MSMTNSECLVEFYTKRIQEALKNKTIVEGARFSIRKGSVIIYQETDDLPDPDKYIILKDYVPEEQYNNFVQLLKDNEI